MLVQHTWVQFSIKLTLTLINFSEVWPTNSRNLTKLNSIIRLEKIGILRAHLRTPKVASLPLRYAFHSLHGSPVIKVPLYPTNTHWTPRSLARILRRVRYGFYAILKVTGWGGGLASSERYWFGFSRFTHHRSSHQLAQCCQCTVFAYTQHICC